MEEKLKMEIGERLTAARKRAGLTQDRAAELIGVDRPRLSGMERGERPVDVLMLSKMCLTYGVSMSSLVAGAEGEQPNRNMQLRSILAEKLDGGEVEALLSGFLKFAERYQRLCAQYQCKPKATDLPDWKDRGSSHTRKFAVEGDAARLRDEWGLDDAPVGLQIFELLEAHGVHVYCQPISDERISGAYLEADIGPMLCINAADRPYRQVFTAAHELAHLLYHRGGGVSYKDDRSAEENLANEFASAFLMPESAIKRYLATREARSEGLTAEDVIDLHRSFGVSYAAMLVRLRRLGILTPERYDELKAVQPVWKAQEMGYPLPDWEFDYHPDLLPVQTRVKWLPRTFRALVLRALIAGELTERQAAKYVNLEYEEFVSLRKHPEPDPRLSERDLKEAEDYVK